MTRICIIPARGGSKRIPDKNIRDFFGRPVIAYSLEAALRSELFDVIHVSTDSARIAEMVEGLSVPVDFLRPSDLADDSTPVRPVLRWVLQAYHTRGHDFDCVCRVTACAPLIEAEDLRRAVALFDSHGGARPILSITRYPVPIEWAYERTPTGALVPVQPGMSAVRSQDLPIRYHDAGPFAFFPARVVLDPVQDGDKNWVGYEVSQGTGVDIDTQDDWSLAEQLFLGRRALNGVASTGRQRLAALKTATRIPMDNHAYLRPIDADDVTERYVEGLNDPEVGQFLTAPRLERQTLESVRAYARANWADPDAVLFGVFQHELLRGTVRLHAIDWRKEQVTVGIALFDRTVWGRGLGSRGIRASTEFAANVLGLRRFEAAVDEANCASNRAFEKAGFRRLGSPGIRLESTSAHKWVKLVQ